MGAQGLEFESSNVVFTVAYITLPLYCVIDLSAGANASSYPVSYLSDVPDGGWTDEYKTTKLVLRRIWPGSFLMRGQFNVTLTKSFYCGVFEVTQKQYTLVMGTNPSSYKGDLRPVDSISYDMIRGTTNGAKWPSSSAVDASSFMGKLRSRTGLDFDLPTDAQWEYACRAGTTSNYNNGGNTEDDLKQLGRYSANQSDGKGGYSEHTTVGSYQPNAWGLYDMHGNVWEWCLDWSWDMSDNLIDPKGASSGTRRRRHGGSWSEDATYSTAARVYNTVPSQNYVVCGFRLFRTLSNGGDERNSEEANWAKQSGVVLCDGKSTSTTVTAWSSWQPNSPLNFSDGLVAHYTFDGNANDDSGNDNDGVLHGVTSTTDRYGNADGAYHFNGTSAYVEVPDSDSLREVGQSVTLSAWMKPEAMTSENGKRPAWISILCKGNDSGNSQTRQYGVQISNEKNWLVNYYNGVNQDGIRASKSVVLHAWSHVAITFTPTAIFGYLNGELIGTATPHDTMIENFDSLFIGFDPPEDDEYFSGDMDEVRIYNRVLSPAEVRALSNGDNPTAVIIGGGTYVYRYDVVGGIGVVQSGFGAVDSLLNIPAAIGNKPVVAIGRYAFADCGDIEAVTIPSSVAEIGDSAFAGCSNLSQVTLSGDIRTLTIGGNAFEAATAVTIENKPDYEFVGWTNATGRIISDPFHSATAVTVSPWWRKIVDLSFDANGGTGVMNAQTVIEGDALVLASNDFARVGYLFQGWSGMVDGETIYADGATIPDVPADMDGLVLYAVWKPCSPEITPVENSVFANASEVISLSHDAEDVIIFYTTDESNPMEHGREYKGAFAVYESCRIRAVAYGAGRYSDEIGIALTRADGLSEAVNLYGYLMETDDSRPWTVVTDVSHDGVSCARSGTISHGGMTWLQTSVRKAGTVSFWWKAACEEAEEEDGETYWYDYGAFLVDGVVKAKIAGNDTGWRKIEVDVPTGGKHVLRWEYSKDGVTTYSPDCIWLDQVQWIPADGSGYTLTTPDPVPYSWLISYNLGLDSDFETAAKQATGKVDVNGGQMAVWQDYVAGTDPTNPNDYLRAMIAVSNDVPIVTWTPNLNTNGEVRVYTVMGKTNLTDAAWVCPTNSSHRFFKVKVALP